MLFDKCYICGSHNTEKRNVITAEDSEGVYETEFSLYCKNCGNYIGTFDCGHWEY